MSIWEKKQAALAGRSSLTQVRLNAFVEGDGEHATSVCLWMNRFRHDRQTYSLKALRRRERELVPKVEALERVVRFPDPEMDPEAWLEERGKLARLTGQLWAIRYVLERDGDTWPSGLEPSTSDLGSELKGAAIPANQDPFAFE